MTLRRRMLSAVTGVVIDTENTGVVGHWPAERNAVPSMGVNCQILRIPNICSSQNVNNCTCFYFTALIFQWSLRCRSGKDASVWYTSTMKSIGNLATSQIGSPFNNPGAQRDLWECRWAARSQNRRGWNGSSRMAVCPSCTSESIFLDESNTGGFWKWLGEVWCDGWPAGLVGNGFVVIALSTELAAPFCFKERAEAPLDNFSAFLFRFFFVFWDIFGMGDSVLLTGVLF